MKSSSVTIKIHKMKEITYNLDNGAVTQKTNREVGKMFETYVYNNIYPKGEYDLITISPQFNPNRYIRDNLKPDLKLNRKNTTTEFWVECKFRSNLKTDYIEFDKKQIERYNDIQEPITYLLGLGGTPDNPKIVFSIPFAEVLHRMEISNMERYIFNSPLKIEKDSGEWSIRTKDKSY